jgi:hypothetical protein
MRFDSCIDRNQRPRTRQDQNETKRARMSCILDIGYRFAVSALDRLLNNKPDAWERGAFSGPALVSACCEWLSRLPRIELGATENILRARRALWLVDRLCGDTCPDLIVDLDQPILSATVHYIRARRAPALILEVDPKYPDISRACDAWVSAHTPTAELLRWYDLGERIVASGSFWGEHTTLPVDEYGKLGADPAALMPLLASPAAVVSITAARHLVRRVAADLGGKPGREDELLPSLRQHGAAELADEIEMHLPSQMFSELSIEMFLCRAEAEDLTAVAGLVESAESELALGRLVDLVQHDSPELWQAAMHVGSFSNEALRMFCEWVNPDQSDLLLPHIGDADPARAAIAFHSYLYRAPADAVGALADASPHEWMKCAWDRFQFAPEAVRPQERLPDIQAAENDIRLHDPFNWLGH